MAATIVHIMEEQESNHMERPQRHRETNDDDDNDDIKMISDFAIATDRFTSDRMVLTNPQTHYKIKCEAFKLVEQYYVQTFNEPIEKRLRFKEFDDQVVLTRDQCVHHLIHKINDIVQVFKLMKTMPKLRRNMYIFLPYYRQLRLILHYFKDDFCCRNIINDVLMTLDCLTMESNERLEIVKTLYKQLQVMMVFTEPVVYECNICHETSGEKHFLKQNECCGYNICNACYAKLWQHCKLYPVCPVCKTSFKSVSVVSKNYDHDDDVNNIS
ncbi:exon0 [Hemileuca sp. nucleopolyhedrovirus]|uniref:Exon0 n=1 Tax=Hemileuca sp. nucleopolyhedrovirus TaxID=1367203 RepID=S5MJY8_9ABAC|nr:exon0 [Hemileuca sp. nucleopolyhedrovirus]AGR56761.1 exon0 [Hemileuca sp. nucleopolyhedrovirus]